MSLLTCAGLATEISLARRLKPKWRVAAYGLESQTVLAVRKDDKIWLKADTLLMVISFHECVTLISLLETSGMLNVNIQSWKYPTFI